MPPPAGLPRFFSIAQNWTHSGDNVLLGMAAAGTTSRWVLTTGPGAGDTPASFVVDVAAETVLHRSDASNGHPSRLFSRSWLGADGKVYAGSFSLWSFDLSTYAWTNVRTSSTNAPHDVTDGPDGPIQHIVSNVSSIARYFRYRSFTPYTIIGSSSGVSLGFTATQLQGSVTERRVLGVGPSAWFVRSTFTAGNHTSVTVYRLTPTSPYSSTVTIDTETVTFPAAQQTIGSPMLAPDGAIYFFTTAPPAAPVPGYAVRVNPTTMSHSLVAAPDVATASRSQAAANGLVSSGQWFPYGGYMVAFTTGASEMTYFNLTTGEWGRQPWATVPPSWGPTLLYAPYGAVGKLVGFRDSATGTSFGWTGIPDLTRRRRRGFGMIRG